MTPLPRSYKRSLVLAALAAAALLFFSCAPADKAPPAPAPPPGQESAEARPAPAPEPERPRTVGELLRRKMREQYSPLASIYEPPGLGNGFHVEIARTRKQVVLADGVVDFAGGLDGLAVLFASGLIELIGEWPCESLTMPSGAKPGILAWKPASVSLAASEKDKGVTRIFELMSCAEISVLEQAGVTEHLAVSPRGARLAAIDRVHDLRIGPVTGPLGLAARLRFAGLDLDFSPAGNLVLAVDQMGWLTSWSAETGERVETARIPGWPFESAEISGRTVFLKDMDGRDYTWDIPDEKFVAEQPPEKRFLLREGLLSFREKERSYVKRLHLGEPRFEVGHSRSAGVLRIVDVDGTTRYYSTVTGRPSPSVEAPDWSGVDLDRDAGFSLDGREYRLADPVHRQGGRLLMARSVPDEGFRLWWVRESGRTGFLPKPGVLPVRSGILPQQVEWRRIFSP
jgi:hypothetical protein